MGTSLFYSFIGFYIIIAVLLGLSQLVSKTGPFKPIPAGFTEKPSKGDLAVPLCL